MKKNLVLKISPRCNAGYATKLAVFREDTVAGYYQVVDPETGEILYEARPGNYLQDESQFKGVLKPRIGRVMAYDSDRWEPYQGQPREYSSLEDYFKGEYSRLWPEFQKILEKGFREGGIHPPVHQAWMVDTLPYVALKATKGGGWSTVGKIINNKLVVPKGDVGMFIGRGGAQIKEICRVAGRKLQVVEATE